MATRARRHGRGTTTRTARMGLAVAVVLQLAACDDPVGPAHEIAGEYELAARVEGPVQTPVGPGEDGALLLLRSDRTWLLTRHRGDRRASLDGFGLTDRYRFDGGTRERTLTMFTEGPFLEFLAGSATVTGDTLRWGAEVFVRR